MNRRLPQLAPTVLSLALAALLAAALATTVPAGPTDPRIAIRRLDSQGDEIALSFRLDNAFDDNLKRSIDSGLPTGYTFVFQLLRARKGWINNVVRTSRLQVEAMYNAVTREYLINYHQDGNLIESRVVREPEELRQSMTSFRDLPLFSTADLPPGQRFQLRVRADLGTRTVFFFVPRTVSTDWASRRFRIPREDADGAP